MNATTQIQVNPQAPLSMLAGDILKRETEKALKKQAPKERAAAKKPEISRQQLAIDMAINLMEARLGYIYRPLMDETAKCHDEGVLDALNLIDIGQEKIAAMRERCYQTHDDCAAGFIQLGALVNAIARAYGDKDTVGARAIKGCVPCVDVMLTMIEIEGGTE